MCVSTNVVVFTRDRACNITIILDLWVESRICCIREFFKISKKVTVYLYVKGRELGRWKMENLFLRSMECY